MTSVELPHGDPTIETEQVWIYALGPDSVARESDLDLREEMELARQGQLPTGKWLILVAPNEIAGIWNSVAAAVVAGKLGDSAKVSTAAQDRDLHSYSSRGISTLTPVADRSLHPLRSCVQGSSRLFSFRYPENVANVQ